MKTLAVLPISTKNMLEESRVLTFIQRWAQTKVFPQQTEMDGYSSENTSRAQTPLNTPDGTSTKLGPELDSETSKPAVYRRLKIISENSLDSALSDASKASDGKEEEEEDDDEEEDAGPPNAKPLKTDVLDPLKESVEEPVKEVIEEKHEEVEMSSSSQQQHQNLDVKDKNEFDITIKETEIKEDESQMDELQGSEVPSNEHESGKIQISQTVAEIAELERDQPLDKVNETESQSNQTDAADLTTTQPSEDMKVQQEVQEVLKAPPSSKLQPCESVTNVSETPEATVTPGVLAVPVEPSGIGTPSQDEEDGVSDVESERSQEPQLSVMDISGMAAKLLESWKDLKVCLV